MSLYDHLRELRYRVIVSTLAIVMTSSLCAFLYRPILNVVMWPWDTALVQLQATFTIFGCFVFGAIATPSTDPFSMTALALPVAITYVVAEFICRRHDTQKAKKIGAAGEMIVSIDG
jgi:Sec-independent protein secretion pathway component TatC